MSTKKILITECDVCGTSCTHKSIKVSLGDINYDMCYMCSDAVSGFIKSITGRSWFFDEHGNRRFT